MKQVHYYLVYVVYKSPPMTSHLIEAESKEEAVRIVVQYQIYDPRRKDRVVDHMVREITAHDPAFVRRSKHIGGKIHYEENNELKHYPKADGLH